ncbi:molybdate ABC transporter substrate-binding protein, partial [Acinetobacter baumannii]
IGDSKLAIGNPASVPAGSYAEASLKKLGAWDALQGKLALTENVRGALTFVARGEAKYGIVYKTDALAEPKVKIVGTFPADS